MWFEDTLSEIFKDKWSHLEAKKYIDEVRRAADVVSLFRTPAIDLSQIGAGISGLVPVPVASDFDIQSLIELSACETKQYTVTTPDEWRQFFDSCYTVRFKCKKRWQDPDAENYALNEWIVSEDYIGDPKVRPLEVKNGKLPEDIIVTAFDSEKCRRIIISGLHRGAAVTIRTRECDPAIPPVRVYECRGKNIDRIFPCDLLHF
jgi:hypothetical protein